MSRRVVHVVAVTAALVATLAACSSGGPVAGSSAPAASATPTASTASPTPPSPTPGATVSPTPVAAVRPTPAGSTAPCTQNQLGAVETRHGSTAGQPFSVIKVVNGTKRPCTLSGYPRPAFWAAGSGRLVKLPLKVTHGSTHAAPDPGPTRFLVPPGGTAWFAVGTGTAHGGRLRSLTYFTFYPTADTSSVGVLCGVNLTTDSPNPIPVVVTAFAPGPGPTA